MRVRFLDGFHRHDQISWLAMMDEYSGFKVLARQIHPHTGGGALMVEADNLAAVQKHTYPWTKGLGVTATIMPGLSDEEYVELEASMIS